ncbi:bifunctional (p)ppGpp synthetase/guanosine-3',5'-bis(diphosphate) 3'-pyrophosphohydrolase [Chloroflexia bacterium SDU3-3]|nr:bifunctional (p)ppGpp synthetase/guanosine-3',5'-bis(diphosphate) 3'-pyrophosphohydrolase [Chloroflexia bacterium SDU3-3]
MSAPWSPESYHAAYRFAAEAHLGQRFPGTELPYLLHVGSVAMEVMTALVAEPSHDADLAVQCALLHDVLEDTEVTPRQLGEQFGEAVLHGVQALSKNPALLKDEQMPDSLRRIQQQPSAVWLVKLADRICNLERPPSYWTEARRRGYRAEAREIHQALASASPALGARLALRIEQYRRFSGEPN